MFLYFPSTLPKILNFLHAYISIYIHRDILTIPLKMTEVGRNVMFYRSFLLSKGTILWKETIYPFLPS